MLIKYSRDCIFSRITKLVKQVPSGKIKKIQESHSKSSIITVKQIDGNNWKAKSKDTITEYDISKIDDNCKNKCPLRCDECNICIHQFTCTCNDNFLQFNICKHIHACARSCEKNSYSKNNVLADDIKKEITEIASIASSSNISEVVLKEKKDLITKWGVIKTILERNNLNSEERHKINKKMNSILSICNKDGKGNFEVKAHHHSNSNIVQQMRFISTKKRKAKDYEDQMTTTAAEKKIITEALLSAEGETELVSNSPNFDHSYIK